VGVFTNAIMSSTTCRVRSVKSASAPSESFLARRLRGRATKHGECTHDEEKERGGAGRAEAGEVRAFEVLPPDREGGTEGREKRGECAHPDEGANGVPSSSLARGTSVIADDTDSSDPPLLPVVPATQARQRDGLPAPRPHWFLLYSARSRWRPQLEHVLIAAQQLTIRVVFPATWPSELRVNRKTTVTGPNLGGPNYRALLYQATGLCPRRYRTRPTLNGLQSSQIWAG